MSSRSGSQQQQRQDSPMVDEMFDGIDVVDSVIRDAEDAVAVMGGHGASAAAGAGGAASLLSELTSNDRTVHADFQNSFGIDLYDDNDLN